MKSSCPKRCVNVSTTPDFATALWCNRGYLGARVRGTSFPQQFTCPYKEWYKRSFCYWLIAVGRCSLDRQQRSEKPNFI